MNAKELLEEICNKLEKTKTDEWSKVELKCGINLMEHFEPTDSNDAFVGCEQHRYPKDAKTYGVEVFVNDKCVFRKYDVIKNGETEKEAEDRIAQMAVVEFGYRYIEKQIKLSNEGFILF